MHFMLCVVCCRFGEDTFIIREMIGEVTAYVNTDFELRQVSEKILTIQYLGFEYSVVVPDQLIANISMRKRELNAILYLYLLCIGWLV